MVKYLTIMKESASLSGAVKKSNSESTKIAKRIRKHQKEKSLEDLEKNVVKDEKQNTQRDKILASMDPCWANKSRQARYMQIKHSGLAEERWCDFINRMERRINRNMKKSMTGAGQSAQQQPKPEFDCEALKGAQGIQSPPDPPKEI